MFFLIYKITNKLNNKIYIGMHKTSNPDDGYMGSGTILKRAIKKYGLENFSKEVLFSLKNEEEMIEKEREIVDEEFCSRKDTYNICVGGKGGFGYINQNGLSVRNFTPGSEVSKKGNEKKRILLDSGGAWLENYKKSRSKSMKKYYSKNGSHWSGRSHSSETKAKMSKSQKGQRCGSKNGQFGKMWITNGIESKRILRTDVIPDGWSKGRIIKIKF